MKRFLLVLTTTLLVTVNLAGCSGNQMETSSGNSESPWVDIQSEGYNVNDSEFVPAFVKANKASLNKLAKMLLSYDFSFYIVYEADGMHIITYTKNFKSVKPADEDQRNGIEQNDELMLYLTTLLQFQYVNQVGRQSESINTVAISFKELSTSNGSLSRGVAYIPIKDWIGSLFKDGIPQGHVAGNWYYSAYPNI